MSRKEYLQNYYQTNSKPDRFKDRKCRICDILLKSKHGAYNTRSYCRSCVDKGLAKKHVAKLQYQKNRKKRLAYQKQYDATKKMLQLPN